MSQGFEFFGIDAMPLVAAAIVLGGAYLVWRAVRKPPEPDYVVAMKCAACGWAGRASKYNKKCPSCAKPSLKMAP